MNSSGNRARGAQRLLFCAIATVATAALAGDAPEAPLRSGEILSAGELVRLRAYLPAEFWAQREFFFYDGMRVEIASVAVSAAAPACETSIAVPHADRSNGWVGASAAGAPAVAPAGATPDPACAPSDFLGGGRREDQFGVSLDAPFDARGIRIRSHRYAVPAPGVPDPAPVAGGAPFDAVAVASALLPQYAWECRGGRDVLALWPGEPLTHAATPKPRPGRWALRRAVLLRGVAGSRSRDVYLDAESGLPLYSVARSARGDVTQLIWHDPRDSRAAGAPGDTILNVQSDPDPDFSEEIP